MPYTLNSESRLYFSLQNVSISSVLTKLLLHLPFLTAALFFGELVIILPHAELITANLLLSISHFFLRYSARQPPFKSYPAKDVFYIYYPAAGYLIFVIADIINIVFINAKSILHIRQISSFVLYFCCKKSRIFADFFILGYFLLLIIKLNF